MSIVIGQCPEFDYGQEGFTPYDGPDLNILDQIWSDGKPQDPVKNAYRHWKDHKDDFPELNNAKEYVKAAQDFINNPPKTAKIKFRSNGDKVVYDITTDILAIGNKDGNPRTMYKHKPMIKHKFPNNLEYFDAQSLNF